MKSTFCHRSGSIFIEATPAEAEHFRHGLNLLHQLYDQHEQKAEREAIIEMSATLIESIIDSHGTAIDEELHQFIEHRIPMLETNRMTTIMFEMATTRDGWSHRLKELEYNDNQYNKPSRATGIVKYHNDNVRAAWDRFGRCFDRSGNRREEFDLVLRMPKKETSAKLTGESVMAVIITILLCCAI